MRVLRRLVVMAFLGALGALVGAGLGEVFFLLKGPRASAPEPREICLVFDLSESMLQRTRKGESQLDTLRAAAKDFVANPDFGTDRLSLVGFSDDARLVRAPGSAADIPVAVDDLRAGGRTHIGAGLDMGRDVLSASDAGAPWILLFTDGKPQVGRHLGDPVELARTAAADCRAQGIRIVAVGTGLADRALLEELTGDPANVFISAPEALGEAFRRSGELIRSHQLLASAPVEQDFEGSMFLACGWAAFVALGASLALVTGTSRYQRRRLRVAQVAMVVVGATLSGLVAGGAGQGTFYFLTGLAERFEPILRSVSWMLLGAYMVVGMSYFVPNLPRLRALAGGAVGGAFAVLCFMRVVPEVGDVPARLGGAAVLGFMAGAMAVLVEATVRKGWLIVHWGKGETTKLNLGAEGIVVGRSARAHINPGYHPELEPVIGTFVLDEKGIGFVDEKTKKRHAFRGGSKLRFDQLVVEVCEGAPEDPAAVAAAAERRREAGSASSDQPNPESPLPRPEKRRQVIR